MNYFRTDSFTRPTRLSSWRDQINHLYPSVDLIAEEDDAGFIGRIAWRDVGATRVSRIESVAQKQVRTARQARADHQRLVQINFQVEGDGWVDQLGRNGVTRPGELILYDSACPYEMGFVGPFRGLSLELPRSAIEASVDGLDSLMARPIPGNRGAGRFLFEFVRSLAADEDPPNHTLALRLQRHALELLITALMSSVDSGGGRIRNRRGSLAHIKRYVRERLDDSDLTLDTIAEAHHMSLRYLHAIFRAASITPFGWIQGERLERSRADLQDPLLAHLSVCEIAHRWCFGDAAHFSRAFRRQFGYSPKSCRLMVQGG